MTCRNEAAEWRQRANLSVTQSAGCESANQWTAPVCARKRVAIGAEDKVATGETSTRIIHEGIDDAIGLAHGPLGMPSLTALAQARNVHYRTESLSQLA
jgi:hypothetical protein